MPRFAQRMTAMEQSAQVVRRLFGSMNDPEIISFGGGAPAKETLPVDLVREIANDVIRTGGRGVEALQYGGVMGVPDLREVIARDLLAPKGIAADPGIPGGAGRGDAGDGRCASRLAAWPASAASRGPGSARKWR